MADATTGAAGPNRWRSALLLGLLGMPGLGHLRLGQRVRGQVFIALVLAPLVVLFVTMAGDILRLMPPEPPVGLSEMWSVSLQIQRQILQEPRPLYGWLLWGVGAVYAAAALDVLWLARRGRR